MANPTAEIPAAILPGWKLSHIESHEQRRLSFWRGPGAEAMVVLSELQPVERALVNVNHGSDCRRPATEPREGSFLLSGARFGWQGPHLADFGVFAGWWPGEPGA